MVLTKKNESLIRALYTRHGRKKYRLALCEGKRAVADLLQFCPKLIKFIVIAEERRDALPALPNNIESFAVSEHKFNSLAATVSSQGILAVTACPPLIAQHAPIKDPFVLVLDRLTDPGNFGSILRTARAIGLTELWYTAGSVSPFNDKVIRAAMASQFVLGLRRFDNLDQLSNVLRQLGYQRIYRTDPHQGENCFTTAELFTQSAIIIGNEADGAAPLTDAEDITIPMPGSAESLNAAQAATVILFDHIRRNST